jgi:hypothetical protein
LRIENKNKLKIIKLIEEYCELEDGFYVEKYLELIIVCIEPDVYISRRALKHFVERRKVELLKNNSLTKTIEILISMVLYIQEVVKNSDSVTIEELGSKIIYEKLYNKENDLSIRVVTELVSNERQVKSIHFIKTKIPP